MAPQIDEKFTDQRTGETVSRIKVPENLSKEIKGFTQANAQHAGNFMQMAKQSIMIIKQLIKEYDSANESEQNIGKEVIRIREKIGLDSSWIYNIPLGVMEKREPPEESGLINGGIQQ